MKRSRILTLLLCLLLLGAGAVVILTPCTVPYEQCSDIYRKYAGTDGIKAAFVKDYKVNDTVLIDATVLEATTDSAWAVLQNDFNVPIIPEEYRELFDHSIDFRLAPKNNPKALADSIMLNNDIIVVSREAQTISVFHIVYEHQLDIIWHTKTHELTQQEYEN